MKTIETIATITPTQEFNIQLPEGLPVGTFKVLLVIDENSIVSTEHPQARDESPSFLEVAGDLIGSLEGLPSDLSINKSYMDGFGNA